MSVEALDRELAALFPADRLLRDTERRAAYASDRTECEGTLPDLVVEAATADEARQVLAAAVRHRVPLVPVAFGTNLGGLALPLRGGVVLDLRRMDRIVEVDADDRYIVVEPGVTWKQVRDHLAQHHPGLRFAYSLAPPESSVLANALMDGLVNLSLVHGTTSQMVTGLEVLLATGETVRTGSRAHGPSWHGRPPLPDLTGLFVNAHGSAGIVVKAGLELYPQHPHRQRLVWLAPGTGAGFAFVRAAAHEELCDDLAALSTAVAKLALGVAAPRPGPAGEPPLLVFADLSASRPAILAARRAALDDLAREHRLGEALDAALLQRLLPGLGRLAELPTRLDFLLDAPGGGLTWVGTFGPTSRWSEGAERGLAVLRRHGRPELMVTRAMRGAHFGVLRFVTLFERASAAERERVRALNEELGDAVVDLGFFPYKTPRWALERYRDRLDPGFLALLERVRSVLDPSGILAPGRSPS